jgi:hypothetical protein
MSELIIPYYAERGTYYELVEEDNKKLDKPIYLGEYVKTKVVTVEGKDAGIGERNVYVFEKKELTDGFYSPKIRKVGKQGGRRKSRKRKTRRSRKTARK